MPQLIPAPTIIPAPGNKQIREYVGRVNTGAAGVRIRCLRAIDVGSYRVSSMAERQPPAR